MEQKADVRVFNVFKAIERLREALPLPAHHPLTVEEVFDAAIAQLKGSRVDKPGGEDEPKPEDVFYQEVIGGFDSPHDAQKLVTMLRDAAFEVEQKNWPRAAWCLSVLWARMGGQASVACVRAEVERVTAEHDARIALAQREKEAEIKAACCLTGFLGEEWKVMGEKSPE